jgi:16S rRNA pseudouridine516 synthase
MFGHFHNKVVGLHRKAHGDDRAGSGLVAGPYRDLSAAEIACF